MAQVVSDCPLTPKAQVRSLANPGEICGGRSDRFSSEQVHFPVSIIPPVLHFHPRLPSPARKTNGLSPETFKK
jgi:hypothetical protein